MEVIYPRCAGLDVHEETVVGCVRLAVGSKITREVRNFETTTSGLLELLAWLTERGCSHVAMEAPEFTGSRFGTFSAMARSSAGHLLSWAGFCPRNDESAGKRRSSRLRKGAPWLKTLLVQCAWAATRKKSSYLQAQFHRLRSRRGPKKAICAVAASILTAVYHMFKNGTGYQDLGADHFDRRSKQARTRRLVSQLASLGYDVQITPLANAA